MRWWYASLVVLLGAACGRSQTDVGGDEAETGGAGAAGGMGGAGASGAAGAATEVGAGGAAGASDLRGVGRIVVVSLPGSAQLAGASTTVTFDAPAAPERCFATRTGDCERRTCSENEGAADAGRIFVVSAVSDYHADIDPTDGVYPTYVVDGSFPAEGDYLSAAAASGHAVPAFFLSTNLPYGLVVSSPVTTGTTAVVSVPRSADFVLEWNGGAPGVRAELEAKDADTWIRCAVEATLGRLTVPASLLDALDPGTPLVATTVADVSDRFGDYDVTLTTAVGVYDASHTRLDFELE